MDVFGQNMRVRYSKPRVTAILLIATTCFHHYGATEPATLQLVQILFRHGDRTPIDPFPTDLYRQYWKEGLGQLTNIGKMQHFAFGQYLRERYKGFLENSYNCEDILVNSTNVDRTLMSASSNLAGLWPPFDGQIWNKNLLWQPIPIHTVESSEDYVLDTDAYCPKYDTLFEKLLRSQDMQKINKENKELYEFLTKKTGRTISNIFDVNKIHDTLLIEKIYNLTIPSWVDPVYEKLRQLADLSFAMRYSTIDIQRLKGGPLLGNMINNMLMKSNHVNERRKLYMFSSHDTSVAVLLSALNVFNGLSPPYTCAVIVELHLLSSDTYGVQLFYRNSTEELVDVILPNCSSICPLDRFITLTKHLVPTDILKECEVHRNSFAIFPLPVYIIVGCVAIFFVVFLIIAILCWKKYQGNDYRYVMVQNE